MSHRAPKICTFWWAFSRLHFGENVGKPFRIVELGRWVVEQDFPFHFPFNFTQYFPFFSGPLDWMMLVLVLFKRSLPSHGEMTKLFCLAANGLITESQCVFFCFFFSSACKPSMNFNNRNWPIDKRESND